MARLFSSNDVRSLTELYNRDLKTIQEAVEIKTKLEGQIKSNVTEMLRYELMQVLDTIPIEQLNYDKKGMRISVLKEHGYQTMKDISAAGAKELEDIKGIGSQGAREIYQSVHEMIQNTAKRTRISLNYDVQTPQSDALVQSICRYRAVKEMDSLANSMHHSYTSKIQEALQELQFMSNALRWMFASREKKDHAQVRYRQLTAMQSPSHAYQQGMQEIRQTMNIVDRIGVKDGWEGFQSEPIAYWQIVEKIVPGIFEDDSDYGLPQEIAREVQGQPFALEGLRCQLRGYQEFGVKYILHQENVLLGDEMGLGKTVQAIAAMVVLRNMQKRHFLVVCPASVIGNWTREITKHSDLSAWKIHGKDRFLMMQEWIKNGGVAVTTYETASSISLADDFVFSLLVVDEAHYIKNPNAKRTKSVAWLAAHAERKLFMTGTALENNVEEMIRLIDLLQPDVAQKIRHLTYLAGAPQFQKEIASVYYRRKREDVLQELPDLIESEEWCELNPVEEELYDQAVLDKKFNEARRVSWTVDDLRDSSKAMRMMELILEAEEEGRKILIFSFFLDTIQKISQMLSDRCLNPITGSVGASRRQEIIDEFEHSPAGTVLCAQIQAGGTGLNIQSASVVILCEPQLKPSIENQAVARAYRMGQTRNVLVYRLLCDDTIDERILDLLDQKQEIFDAFADEAAAAKEDFEIDETSLGKIIEEEVERIRSKKGIRS